MKSYIAYYPATCFFTKLYGMNTSSMSLIIALIFFNNRYCRMFHDLFNQFLFLFKKLHWSIVNLQYYVNFFCIAKRLSYIYMYLFHILFHYGLSRDTEYSSVCFTVESCCLSIPYKYYSLFLLIPNLHSFPCSPLLSPLATTNLFSMSMSLFLFCRYVDLYHILDSTFKWYHMVFVFLFLTSLSNDSL